MRVFVTFTSGTATLYYAFFFFLLLRSTRTRNETSDEKQKKEQYTYAALWPNCKRKGILMELCVQHSRV